MNEEIGYGRPPKKRQFQKGRSGNPGGRRKLSGTIDTTDILDRPITVITSAGKQTIDPFETKVENLFKKAMNGDMRSALEVLRLCDEAGMFSVEAEYFEQYPQSPKEWPRSAWLAMFNKYGAPPWNGPLDGLIPEERRRGRNGTS